MQKIVLYGVGLEGEKFYCKFRNKFDFVYAVDKNCNRLFHGLPVYSFDEVKENLKNYFVYVAVGSDSSWREIQDTLKKIGLVEFKDFMSIEFADRELAILYGNCHMYHLMRYLQVNPVFHRKYVVRYYFKDIDLLEDNALKECHLFITQDIRKNNELELPSAEEMINRLSMDYCVCIKVPNLFGVNLFFPQLKRCEKEEMNYRHQLHLNEEAIDISKISKGGVERIKDLSANTLMWIDVFLEHLYRNGGGISEIKYAIENEDFFSKEQIIENFDNELIKLKKRERECDIKISDFIEKNYKKVQLFYEPFHPTNEIIFEKGRRILELLKMPICEDCKVSDLLDGAEVFVYGCVRRALGLEYRQDYIRKSNLRGSYRFTLCNIPITLEEYIEEYIAWNIGEENDGKGNTV